MDRGAIDEVWSDVARILFLPSEEQREGLGLRENENTFFGSGRLIGRNLILTARHVLESKTGVVLPDEGWEVRLLADRVDGRWAGPPLKARVVWRGQGALDLALLLLEKVERSPNPRLRLRLGRYDSATIDLEGVWLAGFPYAARVEASIAREYGAPARLRRADAGPLYRITVAAENAPREGVDWRGCSGGGVLLRKRATIWLIGAIQHVPRAFGAGALDVAPVVAAWSDAAFKQLVSEHVELDYDDVEALERLAGPYDTIGAEPFAASRRTFSQNTGTNVPFCGRETALEELDKALDRDRAIVLLRAEAGLGKSMLIARWADRCAGRTGVTVVRHAFSVREPRAATRADMVESLVRQLAYSLGPDELGQGEPGDARRLEDRFATCIGRDQPEGTRLVIVLDALDEAAEVIEPWSTTVGRSVYIIATCRAEIGETPEVLRTWYERYEEGELLTLRLLPLDASALAAWLSITEKTAFAPDDPAVSKLLKTSEGIPLFASFVLRDPEAVKQLTATSDEPFAASFHDYAMDQLVHLRTRLARSLRSSWSWGAVLKLLALLSVAKAPLSPIWISKIFGGARIDELDQRVERWLWRRDEGVSFAHTRLASLFALVLPKFDVDVDALQDQLIEACGQAWRGAASEPLRNYALTWLPTHLLARKSLEKASHLLGDGAFQLARLVAEPTEAMVRRTAAETIGLTVQKPGVEGDLLDWRRFWFDAEGTLLDGVKRAGRFRIKLGDLFLQLVSDRFGQESSAWLSLKSAVGTYPAGMPRLASPHGSFRPPSLLRAIHHAHEAYVAGVLSFEGGLVSWGGDDALRFWPHRLPKSGGAHKAHKGGCRGVLAADGKLISWGMDGAIRFWDVQGRYQSAIPDAHPGGVLGILTVGDSLLSWGFDEIRFWERDGRPRGRSSSVHRIEGMRVLDHLLVSWSNDGTVCLRDHCGTLKCRFDAHYLGVRDVAPLDHMLLTVGDGIIRFWDQRGRFMSEKADSPMNAYGGEIRGVVVLYDALVTWNSSGWIQFWDHDGQPRKEGTLVAHQGEVIGILPLDGELVSWGADGTIRFWSYDGAPREGELLGAHQGQVVGVTAFGDTLVSWGEDREIQLWERTGHSSAHSNAIAHRGQCLGVRAVDGSLVSWGRDGAVCFWNRRGDLQTNRILDAHKGGVLGMDALSDVLVSWGADSIIRFWDHQGNPHGLVSSFQWNFGGVVAQDDSLVIWGMDQQAPLFDAARFAIWNRRNKKVRTKSSIPVDGVLAWGDSLISWGADGAIRFWSRRNWKQLGVKNKAHIGGVVGVLTLDGALVSWGADGAIRIWGSENLEHDGTDLFPPIKQENEVRGSHSGQLRGVLAINGGLASWGGDGAICFWDRHGKLRPGGALDAHSGHRTAWAMDSGVKGAFAFGERLVSWSKDGAVRLWDAGGEPAATWFAPAPLEFVIAINGDLWIGLFGRPFRLLVP